MVTIVLRCAGCGNTTDAERAKYDPPTAAVMVTSMCPRCDTGDFESVHYLDSDGSEVLQSAI